MKTSNHHIDLRECQCPDCGGPTCPDRDNIGDDGLCTRITSKVDGLPLRCVGTWAYHKIYRLVQYFGIFSGGMKNQWKGLNYVEICSGPGRCVTREDKIEMDGTAIAIIQNKNFKVLSKALFVDASSEVVNALNQRIKVLGADQIARAVIGNFEDAAGICTILNQLPANCLNLVFIDPTECNIPFSTIEQIVKHLHNADLLINVALGTDVNRNIASAILSASFSTVRSKYERFLGLPGFCAQPEVIRLAKQGDQDDLRRKFIEAYTQQLQKLGYSHTDVRPVRHYYHLLFASRNATGLDFWKKACKIDPDGQRALF